MAKRYITPTKPRKRRKAYKPTTTPAKPAKPVIRPTIQQIVNAAGADKRKRLAQAARNVPPLPASWPNEKR